MVEIQQKVEMHTVTAQRLRIAEKFVETVCFDGIRSRRLAPPGRAGEPYLGTVAAVVRGWRMEDSGLLSSGRGDRKEEAMEGGRRRRRCGRRRGGGAAKKVVVVVGCSASVRLAFWCGPPRAEWIAFLEDPTGPSQPTQATS